jgi:serine/threonine-protein kinase
MGVVYEAEQTLGDHSRTVAIKVLLPELSQDHTVLSRFSRECGIVAQLSHQNTVRVYDFGTTENGTLFITMEYVRGQSLAEAVASGPLGVGRSLSIIEQMCHALHEAHELGIVHRDLKPDNVMLTRHGNQLDFVKILDFGIAVRLSAGGQHETKLTQKGMILGTPPYMSPEQFTGGAIRRQSDIYSLGIILYEMLTAKLPFDADSPWAWAQRHLAATPPELPPDMPPAVVATVRSALAKNPDDRPSTTLEFLSRLYARDATILARGPLESKVDPSRALQPGDTQRDPEALSVATARGLRSAADTTARGSTQGDETRLPRAVKTAAGNGAPPNAWLPRAIPITVAPAPRRIARRRSWFAPVATLLAIGVVALAGWLAYWYDLIPFPSDSNPPPLPPGLGENAAPTAQTQTPTNSGTQANDKPPTEQGPRLNVPPVSGSRASRPQVASKGTSAPTTESSAPAASQTQPLPSAVSWPTNWPSLPSSLPSLPTSLPSLPSALPPLPSAIFGIPLPSAFQMNPAAPPSANVPGVPSTMLR